MTLPFFRCRPYACSLKVSTCITRYELAQTTAERPVAAQNGPAHGLQRSYCRECSVGEKHKAGKHARLWPDGSQVVRLRVLKRGDGHPPGTLSAEERARREKLSAQLREGVARRKTREAARAAGRSGQDG